MPGIEDDDRRLGYPMPSYIAAWKTYRTLSNEDDVIAKRLAQAIVIDRHHSKILDIGPGDGRVLVRLLIRLNDTPDKVTFVEPNDEFFVETSRAVHYADFTRELVPLNGKLMECTAEQIASHDIIICTHTAYFLSDCEMDMLLDLVRAGAKMYLVIDHPESVFSRLWQRTAPRFYERVKKHLAKIRALPANDFQISETVITAETSDPILLRPSVRNLVMSMLCYADVEDMHNEELASVQHTISSMAHEGRISCDSLFIEISRRAPNLTSVT